MLAVARAEIAKQWRRPRTYVALGLTVVVPVVVAIALKANPPDLPERQDAFFFLATKSGLFLPVAALRLMSRFLLVVVVALFAGDAVASEASWGNLRSLLARPIPRGRLLAGKLVSAALFAFIATALVAIAGLVAGGIAFGVHPIEIPLLGLDLSVLDVLGRIGLSVLYVFWSLAGMIALSFMVSTMTDAPAGAIFAGVGFYITSQILDAIEPIGSIRNVFPTHYFDAWFDLFTGSGPTADMLRGTLLQIPYVLVFCGIAWWWFRRKDILS
jgi:ABC-2 type transport system permease protein